MLERLAFVGFGTGVAARRRARGDTVKKTRVEMSETLEEMAWDEKVVEECRVGRHGRRGLQ